MTQFTLGVALTLFACAAVAVLMRPPPPPAVTPEGRVVRMLDVTIKDSNTTNRRQRFVCTPEESRR